ncbi:MAG: hypothetical protein WAM73_09380 [Desulfobacterales bacterium]
MRNLFEALTLAPMIRVIRPAVDQRAVFGLYTLWLLFFLDMLDQLRPAGLDGSVRRLVQDQE